jgi:hypothetical protein
MFGEDTFFDFTGSMPIGHFSDVSLKTNSLISEGMGTQK